MVSNTHDVIQLWRELCLYHWLSADQIRQPIEGWRVAKKQVWNLAELSLFSGYADTVSVDPNLHVVAHSEVGKKQLGIPADLEIIRRNSEKRQPELASLVHPE